MRAGGNQGYDHIVSWSVAFLSPLKALSFLGLGLDTFPYREVSHKKRQVITPAPGPLAVRVLLQVNGSRVGGIHQPKADIILGGPGLCPQQRQLWIAGYRMGPQNSNYEMRPLKSQAKVARGSSSLGPVQARCGLCVWRVASAAVIHS